MIGRGRGGARAAVGAAIVVAASAAALLFLIVLPASSTRTGVPDREPNGSQSGVDHGTAPGVSPAAPGGRSPGLGPGAGTTPPRGVPGIGAIARPPGHGAAQRSSAVVAGQSLSCVDVRTGSPFGYQAQRLLSSGVIDASWTPDSTELCLGSADGIHDLLVPDGSGGAFVAWVDSRLGAPDIYLARVTATGDTAAGWPRGGIPVCSAPLSQYNLDACSDGAAGVILAWQDYRSEKASEVYVERVGADGMASSGWADGGVRAATGAPDQYSPQLAPDGAGGAFVVWQSREPSGLGARMQHVSASGAPASGWPLDGAVVITGQSEVQGLSLAREGAGQLQLLWRSAPDSSSVSLRAVEFDPSSVPDSTSLAGVVTLSSGAAEISEPRLARCPDGSLLVGWAEWRGGQGSLKAQSLGANGAITSGWPADGATVTASAVAISTPAILPGPSGGATIAWEDQRNGAGSDIYAMRLNSDGTRDSSWDAGGVAICTTAGVQYAPALSPDGLGGAIVVWSDAASEAAGAMLAARPIMAGATQLIRIETNSGYARLTWAAQAQAGESYQAYRAVPSGDWELLGVLTPDDSAHVVLADEGAPGGKTVQYRLAVEGQGTVQFFAPVSVDIPLDPTRLELTRAWPSPNREGIEIAFALPRGPAARADVFDVMGRRVGELALNRFTPGFHNARVPMNTPAPSGIYFVRLMQGSRSSTRRVVFLR